jgi:transposase-like protein
VEYSESLKAKMVQKMLPPNGRSAGALAEETGSPQPTLSRWLREAGESKSTHDRGFLPILSNAALSGGAHQRRPLEPPVRGLRYPDGAGGSRSQPPFRRIRS